MSACKVGISFCLWGACVFSFFMLKKHLFFSKGSGPMLTNKEK